MMQISLAKLACQVVERCSEIGTGSASRPHPPRSPSFAGSGQRPGPGIRDSAVAEGNGRTIDGAESEAASRLGQFGTTGRHRSGGGSDSSPRRTTSEADLWSPTGKILP